MYIFCLQMLPPRINTHDWKHSTIILLHKDNPTIIANFRPEALGSTIYKLFMSTKHLYLLDLEKPQNTTSYPRRLPPHEKYNPRNSSNHNGLRECQNHKYRHLPHLHRIQNHIWFNQPSPTFCHSGRPRLPLDAIELISNIYLCPSHNLASPQPTHWNQMWNNPRGHLKPILMYQFLKTSTREASERSIGIPLYYVTKLHHHLRVCIRPRQYQTNIEYIQT